MYYIVYLLYYMPCVMPIAYDGEGDWSVNEYIG